MANIKLRLMSLSGRFCTVKELEVDEQTALSIVAEHAKTAGYTNVKLVDEGDYESVRYTATSPGGRRGRNVAFGDLEF